MEFIQTLINDLEAEKQNKDTPFSTVQINEIIMLLNYVLKNNLDESNYLCTSNEIDKINYWSRDSWPFDNEIVKRIDELIYNYKKLINKKFKNGK